MTYSVHLIKLFIRRDDHLFKLNEAEKLKNVWNLLFFLLALTLLTFVWTAWLGLGTDAISANMTELTRADYELRKAWFLIGRAAYGLLFFLFLLFISSFFYWLFNHVSYKKLIIVQMNVLLVMLLERITWVPLMVYAGIDWYVSPLSFGVAASYFTSLEWVIYFFGSISLFQLFIIWYQVKCLSRLSRTKTGWIWTGVIFWHLLLWAGTSALAYYDLYLLYLIR
ncbi:MULTISPECIES: hypothetical protein [Halobacillus]|uniref:hypothetical protein n=1 Tax=Halobacillus TaxID=45667 RepID=UPI00136D3B49|nr:MULTISPECIES: hypothetical protein [Halobacillus]MCA1023924.1 hypothetical protein [Halobacillus litoralis]MYL31671.1 hypothetical protein [Halobacillus halophilus]MYL39874.1 hypothetical protein [Halobacillus litoralis]